MIMSNILTENKELLVLGIESSCDETAASVIKGCREVLSNVIYSQIDLHTVYGGVVPDSVEELTKLSDNYYNDIKRSGMISYE